MFEVTISTSARARLAAASRFLSHHPPGTEVLLIGASRGAADDLARALAVERAATFGLVRVSLTELAARSAAAHDGGMMTGSHAAAEALAARAVHDIHAELEYFAPVARTPGFPRALARTVHELRLDGVDGSALQVGGGKGQEAARRDLSRLLVRIEEELVAASMNDRAALFRAATAAWTAAPVRWRGAPVLLLDVTIDSAAEEAFAAAVVSHAPAALATMPDGDGRARAAYERMGGAVAEAPDPAPADADLACLRRYVFTNAQVPVRARTGDVQLFSAPGEGREAVEIARRVLDEAAAGVPFDEMAVFLRAPQHYLGLLEHACARAGIPVYFDRGMRRPDPAGRAFVALLACAAEGLSAKRFDEYLSLGQVPRVVDERRESPALPFDEVFDHLRGEAVSDDPDSAQPDAPTSDTDEDAIVAGALRSPWKWEELIVESAVVGGRTREDGKSRWRRRLDGLAHDFEIRIAALAREEPEAPRIARLTRDLRNLSHLRTFALPIIDRLAQWPERTTWGDWIEHLSALASRALSRPGRVLQALADLRPMAAIDDVTLDEVRAVLHDRLVTLDWDPPARRYGRLFVGTPHQARGRSFRVVFVPGLAERVVPQRPREDPLLLDDIRRVTSPGLLCQDDRGAAERLLLKIAIGAASDRLYLSYPRMDVAETRARVPSFYALDVMRAITGVVPDHRTLAAEAAGEAGASLAWPAPRDPARAIDDLEHDLAVLKPLLESRDPAAVRGRAHYLLGLNDALRRSVISRWARSRPAWSSSDGLTKVSPGIAAAIAKNRLGQRPYSLSALQRFSVCPYQFLLATIHRLQPWDEPEPLVRMDPLTRGSLFHKVQAEFFRALDGAGLLPVTAAGVAAAMKTMERVLLEVAAEYEERLAPAIDRVWRDEIDELRRDLGIWVQRLVASPEWLPTYFEFSFGLKDEGRDPRSLSDPVTIDGRFILRGSVDLIERGRDLDVLRVTDHKTGKNRTTTALVVGGGGTLQPVLYSAALEEGLRARVVEGRLFYCTTAGGFGEHPIAINDYTRSQGLQVLTIIDRSIEQGFLPAAPADRACTWCDFRPVCGPREEERVKKKAKDRLADLEVLRSMR